MPWRGQLFGHLTLAPTLQRQSNATGETADIVSHQFILHAGFGVVLRKWAFFHIDVPFAVAQSGDNPNTPKSGSLGDLRLGGRARFFGSENSPIALAVGLDGWLPTGSEKNLTGDGAARLLPHLIASGKVGHFIYAADAGFQFREYLDTGSLEVGNSLVLRGALGLTVLRDRLQVGPEIYGAGLMASKRGDNFSSRSSWWEALLGARVRLGDFFLGAGVGPGLSNAPGTAPRAVVSLAFVPSNRSGKQEPGHSVPSEVTRSGQSGDADGDGVLNAEDACPSVAGVASDDPAHRGCPPEAKPVDTDDDGVPDVEDVCPKEKGESSGKAGRRGCPKPPDRDGDGVPDRDDACPDLRGVAQEERERNGCLPQVDTDRDGIPDEQDICPDDAGPNNPDPKALGCPVKKPAAPMAPEKKPDRAPLKAAAIRPHPEGPAVVTFTGFERLEDGRSRIHVELTHEVTVDVSRGTDQVVYELRGAKIAVGNNRNPLLTERFASMVSRVDILTAKGGKGQGGKNPTAGRKPGTSHDQVTLILHLRAAVTPSHTLVSHPGGATLEILVPAR